MKSESRNILNIFLGLVVLSSLLFSIAPKISAAADGAAERADIKYVPLAPITGTFDSADKTTNLGTYLVGIFRVGVAVAGVLAFLMIVWGGFTYLSTDAITGKEEGKERITRAIGGLVLALASYIILNTIDTSLVKLNLDFGIPAEAAKDIAKPSDKSYSDQLDDVIAEIDKNLKETRATAQALEQAATDAALERNAIMEAYTNGDFDDLSESEWQEVQDRLDALDGLIKESSSLATATRDYNIALDDMKIHELNGVQENKSPEWWKRALGIDTRDAQEDIDRRINNTIETINNNAAEALKSIDASKAKTSNADLQARYKTWTDNINAAQTKSIANICAAWGTNKKSPPCPN
jgi:hypothetical protein